MLRARHGFISIRRLESHWTQPPGLYNGADIAISSRTAAAAKEAGLDVDDSNVFESKVEPVLVKQRTFVKPHEKRYTAADLSDEEAALIVQGAYRSKKAREKMRALIAANYEKKFDAESKTWFYFNKKTGESHWTQPPGLYNGADIAISSRTAAAAKEAGLDVDDSNVFESKVEPVLVKQRTFVKPHEKRYTAADLSDEEAALIVQGAYRSKKAREKMRALIAANYEKKFDAESKTWFYFNKKTGESHWTQPPGLYNGADIAISSRTAAAAKEAGLDVDDSNVFESKVEPVLVKQRTFVKPHEKRYTAADLSDEEAALIVQGAYRSKKAREKMRALIAANYEKKFDAESKTWFYFNKKTGESHWTQPPGLYNGADIAISSRTAAAAKEAGLDVDDNNVFESKVEPVLVKQRTFVKPHEKRYTAADLSDEEAALIVQGAYRSKKAREKMRALIAANYVKKFDPASKSWFYFNKKTGESHWTQPPGLYNGADIAISSRTAAAAKEAGLDVDDSNVFESKVEPVLVKQRTFVKPHEKRYTAADLSDEEAALIVQGAYRSKKAREKMRALIAANYVKKFDPASKSWFYFNKKTGESHWTQPPGLYNGADIAISSRTAAAAKEAGLDVDDNNVFESKVEEGKPKERKRRVKHHEKRYTAADLSDHEAALIIQQAFRAKKARHRFHKMITKRWAKKYDTQSKRFFYYNKETKETQWDPPFADLIVEDIQTSARTSAMAGIPYVVHHTPRFTAESLTPDEAARHIQSVYRAKQSRKMLKKNFT